MNLPSYVKICILNTYLIHVSLKHLEKNTRYDIGIMQLTRHTDYSLRVLMYLAANPSQLVTVAELADFYHISRNHLVKVVQGLVEHGFVETIRGKHGGMQLARESNRISIGMVVRRMENHFNIVECFDADNDVCVLTDVCKLKGILTHATENYLKGLDKISLADVNKPQLRQQMVKLQNI